MHGCSSGSAFLVNAEVDSMGGVIDGGGGIGTKASPRRVVIEKAQAELRQEFDVREERRRELEFLEKGGNPLDFKLGHAASVSVQSTSLTDQHPEQIVTSKAKGSFGLTASPPGDSIESSGRPGGPTVFEPNSADNLLLFDGENELRGGDLHSKRPSRRTIARSEQSSQMDRSQNAKESEDSAIFRPYARRKRSGSNRDGVRSSSMDIIPSHGAHISSLPARHGLRDGRGSISETNNQKDQKLSSISNIKSANINGDSLLKVVESDNRVDVELNGVQETSPGLREGGLGEGSLDVTAPNNLQNHEQNQLSKVDAEQSLVDMASLEPDIRHGKEEVVSASFECKPHGATEKKDDETSSVQLNGFSSLKRTRDSTHNEGQSSCVALSTKKLDSESSCTQPSLSLDGNNGSDLCNNTGSVDDNVIPKDQLLDSEGTVNLKHGETGKEEKETNPVLSGPIANDDSNSASQNHRGDVPMVKAEEETQKDGSGAQPVMSYPSNSELMKPNGHIVSENDGKPVSMLGDNLKPDRENSCTGRPQADTDSSVCECHGATSSVRDSAGAPDLQTCDKHLKVAIKAHEDSILEEARIIEAKRKRIAELSVGTLPFENRRKSHWDLVLEEMTWLANDFAQERLWKITAASQISHRAALTSRLRFVEQDSCRKQRKVAYTLAKAVMEFWHSAEMLVNSEVPSVGLKNCKFDLVGPARVEGNEVAEGKVEESNIAETRTELELQYPGKDFGHLVKEYAVRFLRYNRMIVPSIQAEAPVTPERKSDSGSQDLLCKDHFKEELLFYAVASGAMETYRKSIESYLIQFEKNGISMQEEVDTSMYDAVEELSQDVYDEDEGDTSMYYLPGAFEGSKSTTFSQKKRKHTIKAHAARSYEMGADLPYGHCTVGSQQSALLGKRAANNPNVGSIPTKRVRTASRQRVLSPFSAGATASLQALNRTDASSGDTNSYQDDQSTLNGGSQIQKSLEVESGLDFEKSLPFDSGEISTKPKKKKKAKHLNSAYHPRCQFDSSVYNEQRDSAQRKLESRHLESNGSSGLFGQHVAKKPKMMKPSLDNTFDNIAPMSGSIPSPVASQMSNMSNTNKLMKLIGGRDRGRKTKSLKMPAGQPGCGSPWSLFEDQALVVLVHDMGPNWELVSDAINSSLQFKCIFRKPKECKERHKSLMDKTAGDGADSAEDSGSSQPYPSTLPGIPKGSARQLFQRLQEPMEEDTLKSHFEKIISIGQRQHYRRSQGDSQDLKQIAPVHNTHVVALSQVCPNNLNGGFLTPLDFCDVPASSADVVSVGYQGPHSSGLSITNQGTVASILPASGANSSVQGSSSMVIGSNLSSPSGPISPSVRDGRYGVARTSLPVDEQQRLQQYNPIVPGRNIQQSSLPASGALSGSDRGVRMLPGGNGMGVMSGMNRSIPMSRAGFQGIASSSVLSSGSMLSSGMVGMPSSVTTHSGSTSGQGNSMLRPREALHMMRPGQNTEQQRQMIVPEFQMQVTQGNSQGVPPFNSLSSNFSNQTAPPVPTYPVHPHQQHQMSAQQSHVLHNSHHPHLQGPGHTTGPQQAAYVRLVKERQLHQQRMMQQHQQFSASSALMQHVQPQPQLPLSSSLQNNSQIQQQSSPPVSLPSLTPSSQQLQQKHPLPPHGIGRSPQTGVSGLTNQMGKQRQRQAQQQQQQQQQQLQQSGRHHPQQRQQSLSQQQSKLLKGMGRGNMLMPQNLSIDPSSHLNGISMTPGSQAAEKGDQVMHLMQAQGLYSGSCLNSVPPSRPLVPPQSSNQSQLQQKLFSGPSPPATQVQQMPSHSDNSSQSQVPSAPSGHTLSASHQSALPSVMAPNHQQMQLQLQPHHKQVNQAQPSAPRVLQQNHQMNSDLSCNSQTDQPHTDQQSVNNGSHIGTTSTMPQACMESSNVTPVVSSSASQWKATEPVYDSGGQNPATPLGSIGGSPLTKSSRSNSIPPISQGVVQRQFSGGLPPHGHNVGDQWQQQQPQIKQPVSTPLPSQQHQKHEQQEEELQVDESSQQEVQSQQQTQHLQSGQGSLYIRPTNS